jgi:hypothetical protein
VLLGLNSVTKAYRLYNPYTRKIVVSKDVVVVESIIGLQKIMRDDRPTFQTTYLHSSTTDDQPDATSGEDDKEVARGDHCHFLEIYVS